MNRFLLSVEDIYPLTKMLLNSTDSMDRIHFRDREPVGRQWSGAARGDRDEAEPDGERVRAHRGRLLPRHRQVLLPIQGTRIHRA